MIDRIRSPLIGTTIIGFHAAIWVQNDAIRRCMIGADIQLTPMPRSMMHDVLRKAMDKFVADPCQSSQCCRSSRYQTTTRSASSTWSQDGACPLLAHPIQLYLQPQAWVNSPQSSYCGHMARPRVFLLFYTYSVWGFLIRTLHVY
jgi:hypothetical protein